jgi:hypothetical protein
VLVRQKIVQESFKQTDQHQPKNRYFAGYRQVFGCLCRIFGCRIFGRPLFGLIFGRQDCRRSFLVETPSKSTRRTCPLVTHTTYYPYLPQRCLTFDWVIEYRPDHRGMKCAKQNQNRKVRPKARFQNISVNPATRRSSRLHTEKQLIGQNKRAGSSQINK